MPTTVVNVKSGSAYDVYIGRANPRYRLARSRWANPFKIGTDGTRDDVLQKYRQHLAEHPELLANLHELRGKRLACWCKPEPCHGDILAELADGTRATPP